MERPPISQRIRHRERRSRRANRLWWGAGVNNIPSLPINSMHTEGVMQGLNRAVGAALDHKFIREWRKETSW